MTKKINLIFLSTLILYSLFCALQLGYTWDVIFYYEVGKERKEKAKRDRSNRIEIKEVQFRPGIHEHDVEVSEEVAARKHTE